MKTLSRGVVGSYWDDEGPRRLELHAVDHPLHEVTPIATMATAECDPGSPGSVENVAGPSWEKAVAFGHRVGALELLDNVADYGRCGYKSLGVRTSQSKLHMPFDDYCPLCGATKRGHSLPIVLSSPATTVRQIASAAAAKGVATSGSSSLASV